MFHRMDAADVIAYLDNRQAKGFTVIQVALLAELDGLRIPDRNGQLPLTALDPERPNETWLRWVEWVMDQGTARGFTFALVPAWGDKVKPLARGAGPSIFRPANAHRFTRLLAQRWRERPLLWFLGGDRNPESAEEFAIWDAMAAGLIEGRGPGALITFHPEGYRSSSEFFHDRPWLAFNALQSGHGRRDYPVHQRILTDTTLLPRKPVIDVEPCYEDVPVEFWKLTAGRRWTDIPEAELTYESYRQLHGYMGPWDVRKAVYRALFAGAAGAAYGHNAVWQVWQPGRNPRNVPSPMAWRDALDRPAARQMRHVRTMLDRFGWLEPVPEISAAESAPGGALFARSRHTGELLCYLPSPQVGTLSSAALATVTSPAGLLVERFDSATGITVGPLHLPAGLALPWSVPEQTEDAIIIFRPA